MFEELQSELSLDAGDYIREGEKAERATDDLADSTEELEQRAGNTGEGLNKAKTAIGGIGVAAGAAAAGGIAKSVQAFGTFDAAMQESVAIMGDVSEAERTQLEETARDVAKSTTKSHEQAANSYYYLASAGLDAADSMEAMPQVAALAEAGAMDMAQATDVATDTMSAFGLEADELSRVTDTMTGTVNRHNQTMQGLGSAMSQVAPIAAGLGVSIEETSAALGIMGDVGIKAEKAGTGLRSALSSLANPVGKTKETIDELGISVKNSSGEMRPLHEIIGQLEKSGADTADVMALFGNEAGPAMQALVDQGSEALKEEANVLQDMEGVTQEVAETQKQTLNKQLEILKSRLTDIGITVGQTLEPALSSVMEYVLAAVTAFSSWNEAMGGLPATIGLIATAITGLWKGGALLASQMGIAASASSALGAVLGTLSAPILGVVAAVGLLAAAFATDFGNIRSATQNVVSYAESMFRQTLVPAMSLVKTVVSDLRSAFSVNASGIESRVAGLVQAVQFAFQGAIGDALGTVQRKLISAQRWWATHRDAVVQAVGGVVSTLQTLVGWFSSRIPQALAAARSAFDAVFGPVITSARGNLSQLQFAVTNAVSTIRGEFGQTASYLQSSLVPAIQSFVSMATAQFAKLQSFLQPVMSAIQTSFQIFLTGAIDSAIQVLQTFAAVFGQVTAGVLALVRQDWNSAWTSFKNAASLAVRGVEEILRTTINSWKQIFATMGPPLVQAAKTAFGAVKRAALAALAFGQAEVVPRVRAALDQAWTWVRTEGVALAKSALSFLATQALAALEFTQENIVPKVRSGLNSAWTWVRTEGVTLAKQALSFLQTQALTALEFTRENIVPVVRSGLNSAWTWVRTEGVALGKSAFGQLVTLTMNAVDFWQGAIQPKLTSAFGSASTWIMNQGLQRFKSAFRTLGANWAPAVLDNLGLILDAFQVIVPRAASWLSENGPGIIQTAFKAIGRGIRTTILTMLAIPGIVGQAIVSTINGIRDWLQSGGSTRLKNGFINIITGIASYLKNDAWSDLKAAAKFLFDAVMSAAEGLYEGLIGGSLIPDMFQDIVSYIRGVDIQGAIHEILNAAYLWIKNTAAPQFVGAIEDILSNILSAITSTDVKGAFFDVLDSAYRFVTGIASDFKSAGKGLIDAMVNGIKNNAGRVKDKIEDMVGDARDLLPWSDAKEGPFSDLTGSGAAIPETIAKGVEKNLGTLKDVLGKVPSPGPDSRPSVSPKPATSSGGGDTHVTLVVEGDEGLEKYLNEKVDVRIEENEGRQRTGINRGMTDRTDTV